ncbi:hypothetical protein GTR04_3477 [Trichophyton interdigitale]|uniref:Uncharacterized protein n=1 Tax=Trichophyton interdigitale TaxID=101480 RepID=A0A9P4YIR5_9EURO|nr:hypothetical protein GY631_3273 [Trichophyton interdigitale]KAF3896345.1 hypothetical protein GY632_2849 [Trichophyton interdigitale]KAG8209159.1 hypothetical protein GTR04_3477 [Trichophyton interdigitale]
MRHSTCMKTNRPLPCSERQKGAPGGVPHIQSSRGRHQRLLVRQRAERKTNEVMKNACPGRPRIDDRSLLAGPDPQAIIIIIIGGSLQSQELLVQWKSSSSRLWLVG